MPVKPPEDAEYQTIHFEEIVLYSVTACKFHWHDGSTKESEDEIVEDYNDPNNSIKVKEKGDDRKFGRYDRLFKSGLIDQITYNLLTSKKR